MTTIEKQGSGVSRGQVRVRGGRPRPPPSVHRLESLCHRQRTTLWRAVHWAAKLCANRVPKLQLGNQGID